MNHTIKQQQVLHDYAAPLKAALLRGEQDSHGSKLAQAIEWLGKRWVCHPVNRVQRLAEPLPEVFTWKPRVLKGRK